VDIFRVLKKLERKYNNTVLNKLGFQPGLKKKKECYKLFLEVLGETDIPGIDSDNDRIIEVANSFVLNYNRLAEKEKGITLHSISMLKYISRKILENPEQEQELYMLASEFCLHNPKVGHHSDREMMEFNKLEQMERTWVDLIAKEQDPYQRRTLCQIAREANKRINIGHINKTDYIVNMDSLDNITTYMQILSGETNVAEKRKRDETLMKGTPLSNLIYLISFDELRKKYRPPLEDMDYFRTREDEQILQDCMRNVAEADSFDKAEHMIEIMKQYPLFHDNPRHPSELADMKRKLEWIAKTKTLVGRTILSVGMRAYDRLPFIQDNRAEGR